ncbi:MAG: dihydrofolate reductase family protein [Anaerolineaceae bacterium]|nr:dihydrofolate reductase family protein [Anaerolineaceae bacterium]
MRKVIYALTVSLDGFIEAAGGDLSWTNPTPDLFQHMVDRDRGFGLFLYGRRIYEIMSAAWPTMDEQPSATKTDKEYAQIWREKPKIVFSKTLTQVSWNAQLVRDNIAEEVNKLKEIPGGDMIVAGAGLAASFMQLDLIDEYRLYLCPVILGSGKPMFPALHDKISLQLVETHQFSHGVVLLRYQHSNNPPL